MSENLTDFLMGCVAEEEARIPFAGHLGCAEDDSDDPDVIHSAMCPNRILAECKAKRRIVEMYEEADREAWAAARSDPSGPPPPTQFVASALRLALQELALPYVDQPGFRREWRS